MSDYPRKLKPLFMLIKVEVDPEMSTTHPKHIPTHRTIVISSSMSWSIIITHPSTMESFYAHS